MPTISNHCRLYREKILIHPALGNYLCIRTFSIRYRSFHVTIIEKDWWEKKKKQSPKYRSVYAILKFVDFKECHAAGLRLFVYITLKKAPSSPSVTSQILAVTAPLRCIRSFHLNPSSGRYTISSKPNIRRRVLHCGNCLIQSFDSSSHSRSRNGWCKKMDALTAYFEVNEISKVFIALFQILKYGALISASVVLYFFARTFSTQSPERPSGAISSPFRHW